MSLHNPILYKARVIESFRKVLYERGFLEFSTPVARKTAGTALTPRIALAEGGFLRDSPAFALRYNLQLHDRVFEIGPCFRLNDIDRTHLPEFTMLDLYWKDCSIRNAVALAESLVRLHFPGEVRELSVAQQLKERFSVDLAGDPDGERRLFERLTRHYGDQTSSYLRLLDRYIKEEIEPLSRGCCVIVWDFPLEAEARARKKDGTFCVAERVEFQINGLEVIQAYADEPDGDRLAMRAKGRGDSEPEDEWMAQMLNDGVVPPESAGFGIGIERLCQACLGLPDIAESMASRPFWRFG